MYLKEKEIVMLKIDNFEVVGWEHAIRGMRNPKNSWDRSDSEQKFESPHDLSGGYIDIGPNDHKLMMNLADGGPVHAKYRRMITVYVDITAPLYWWKEFDTYKVGTVANSCSTMHKIADKEFTLEDFSYEHLGVPTFAINEKGEDVPVVQNLWEESLKRTINDLNIARNFYISSNEPGLKKQYWWQMIQLLPSSYNQKRTVMLNYEVLVGIYKWRRNHKLDEWHTFCDWIEELPYSELITGYKEEETNV
jgi:hypothetical protein